MDQSYSNIFHNLEVTKVYITDNSDVRNEEMDTI